MVVDGAGKEKVFEGNIPKYGYTHDCGWHFTSVAG